MNQFNIDLSKMSIDNTLSVKEIISNKLLKELTNNQDSVELNAIESAQVRQKSYYNVLNIEPTNEGIDREILLIFAVSWLYQYNGDKKISEDFEKKAIDLIENNYGHLRKPKDCTALGFISNN